MTSPSKFLTHRTAISTDWECGQKYWLLMHEGGQGIVPATAANALTDGIDLHKDLADIALGVSPDKIIDQLEELFPPEGAVDFPSMERLARRVGWIYAFGKWIWPRLMDEFDVEFVERELILEYGDLWIACTPDLVLRDRKIKDLVVFDYKSVGLLGKGWMDHWQYAPQIHINIKAVERETGERVRFGQVIGALKGREDRGRLRHPYVWAYSNGSAWSPDWKHDWSLMPVWDYPDGLVGWVDRLGEEVGRSVFPFSAPVILSNRILDTLLHRRLAREKEVAQVTDMCRVDSQLRGIYFESRFDRCRPDFGSPCPYLGVCHNAVIAADPLGSGDFVVRSPHHELELIDLEE